MLRNIVAGCLMFVVSLIMRFFVNFLPDRRDFDSIRFCRARYADSGEGSCFDDQEAGRPSAAIVMMLLLAVLISANAIK